MNPLQKRWIQISAMMGFSAVTLGAFGAHGLKSHLSAYGLEIYHTGVLYHLIHAVVMLALSHGQLPGWKKASVFFLWGILLFSGSLYILAITEFKKLGMITPFGGIFFLLGWGTLFSATLKIPAEKEV
ncbi:MAG: DUF423 domain-containing protein [Planctomycetota bacterium]